MFRDFWFSFQLSLFVSQYVFQYTRCLSLSLSQPINLKLDMKKTHLLIDCCLLRECIYLFFLFIAPFSCPSTYIWKPAVSLCYKNIEETYKFSEGDVNCTMAGGRLAILNTQEKLMSVKDGKYIISKPITQIFLNWYVFMFKKKTKKNLCLLVTSVEKLKNYTKSPFIRDVEICNVYEYVYVYNSYTCT